MKARNLWLLVLLTMLPLTGCGGQTTTGGVVVPPQAPVTTATPPGGQYAAAQSVVLRSSAGATIYYTTDGSIPSAASASYSAPIAISAGTDLKFFAQDSQGTRESVKTEQYSFVTPLTLRLSIAGVSQSMSGLKVTLTLAPGVTLATNSDGSVPTASITAVSVPAGSSAILANSVSYVNGTLSFILYSTLSGGFSAGEFASVACLGSSAHPDPAGFSAVLEPVGLQGNTLPLAGVSAGFTLEP